jgi:uncharacterized UPF0160 family protein
VLGHTRIGGITGLNKHTLEKLLTVLVLLGLGFTVGLAFSPTKERIVYVLVATHDGMFHADEVFAIAILKKIRDPLLVLRTREPGLLKGASLRVDVGGKYSPVSGDFDHHQIDCPVRESGIPYSSCGLIWDQFGMEFVSKRAGLKGSEVFVRLERTLISTIDAVDNGWKAYDTIAPLKVYDLHWYIDTFIPRFPSNYISTPGEHINYLMHSQFMKAVEWAEHVLESEVTNALRWLEDRDYLGSVIRDQKYKDVIVLAKALPWVDALTPNTDATFVIFPDGLSKNWVLQTVPNRLADKFSARKWLPKPWAGLRDQELANVCGVSDAVFCHKDRFIAIARSFEGIKQMANLALDY